MKPVPSLLYLREDELNDGIELLFFAMRDFGCAADDQLQSSGLGRAHHRALHFIARHPGMSVSDLLSILGITKQSLSRVIKQLVGDGLIVLSTGTRDRRQRLLKLTAKGQALESELATSQRNRFA